MPEFSYKTEKGTYNVEFNEEKTSNEEIVGSIYFDDGKTLSEQREGTVFKVRKSEKGKVFFNYNSETENMLVELNEQGALDDFENEIGRISESLLKKIELSKITGYINEDIEATIYTTLVKNDIPERFMNFFGIGVLNSKRNGRMEFKWESSAANRFPICHGSNEQMKKKIIDTLFECEMNTIGNMIELSALNLRRQMDRANCSHNCGREECIEHQCLGEE